MSTIRVIKDKENPYLLMSKLGIQDCGLSFKATGLLTYLLSLPDNRDIQVEDLKNRKTDQETSITSAIKELEDHGYILRGARKRTPKGGLGGYDYELHETSLHGYIFCNREGSLYASDRRKVSDGHPYEKKTYTGKSHLGKSYLGKSQNNEYKELENNNIIDNNNISIMSEDLFEEDIHRKQSKVEEKEKSSAKKEKEIVSYVSADIFFSSEDKEGAENINPVVLEMTKTQYYVLPGVKYQVDKKGVLIYLADQQSEYEKLLKDVKKQGLDEKSLSYIIDRAMNDKFRSQQIGSIGKFRKKNKDQIPYRVVFLGKIKHIIDTQKKVTDLSSFKS